MQSRSFLKGFGRGFAGAGLLFRPLIVRRDERFDASVEKAWENAAKSLHYAISVEGEHIGKKSATGETRRGRSKVPA